MPRAILSSSTDPALGNEDSLNKPDRSESSEHVELGTLLQDTMQTSVPEYDPWAATSGFPPLQGGLGAGFTSNLETDCLVFYGAPLTVAFGIEGEPSLGIWQ